jgi:hypothetical protein
MTETSRETLQRLRTEQDREETMADEVQARVGPQEWNALISFNTYCANTLGWHLEFYRRTNGTAMYRFRPQTEAERHARAEEWVEDTL